MGTRTNDPNYYFRTSIAVPMELKEALKGRLEAAGLSSVQDLTNMLLHGDGIAELLKPLVPAYRAKYAKVGKMAQWKEKKAALNQLKDLTPEQLAALVESAKKMPTTAQ